MCYQCAIGDYLCIEVNNLYFVRPQKMNKCKYYSPKTREKICKTEKYKSKEIAIIEWLKLSNKILSIGI